MLAEWRKLITFVWVITVHVHCGGRVLFYGGVVGMEMGQNGGKNELPVGLRVWTHTCTNVTLLKINISSMLCNFSGTFLLGRFLLKVLFVRKVNF